MRNQGNLLWLTDGTVAYDRFGFKQKISGSLIPLALDKADLSMKHSLAAQY